MHTYGPLTDNEVTDLLESGESMTVQFKRGQQGDLNDNAIVEAVVCLANGLGGYLFLGVEDNGTVTGLSPRHGVTTEWYLLQAMIGNLIDPPLVPLVQMEKREGVEFAVVSIPQARVLVGTKSGKYLKRSVRSDGQPECVPYPLHEMMSVGMVALGRDYAATVIPQASLDDLDPAEFERFRAKCAQGKGDTVLADLNDHELLSALGLNPLSGDEAVTIGALLLFGTPTAISRYVPTAEIIYQEFDGDVMIKNEALRFPLFRAADELLAMLEAANTQQEVMVGLYRMLVPRLHTQIARESIANALVHRDYSVPGAVQAQLGDETFKVVSPGGLPPGVTLDNLLESSRPRSPILAEAFKRAGIVDRAGRGVALMYLESLRAGRDIPDYDHTTPHAVEVVIDASKADLEMVRFIADFESRTQQSLNLVQLEILRSLKSLGRQGVSELSASLDKSGTAIRETLKRLVEIGLVEAQGVGRGVRYHLTPVFFRTAQAAEYVRLKGVDSIQQGQMVLTYVRQYRRITRSEAADLCNLAPAQARGLLKRLTDRGDLILRGGGSRGALRPPFGPLTLTLVVTRHAKQPMLARVFDDAGEAASVYEVVEREIRSGQSQLDAVLVGSDSLETIKVTHSNYFSGSARRRVEELLSGVL